MHCSSCSSVLKYCRFIKMTQCMPSHRAHACVRCKYNRNENLHEDGKGAAVYSPGISGIYLIYCQFLGNISERDGGALYIEGSISIENCSLEHNSALAGSGGALFAVEGSSMNIQQSTFYGNSAVEVGPAVFLGTEVIYNTANNIGCGNMASTSECDGIYTESNGICADFGSMCKVSSEGQFT